MSKGKGGVSSYTHTQQQRDNYSNQCNPNNNANKTNANDHSSQLNLMNMLSMKLIGNMPEELKKAKKLYYHAFPKNERRSFPELVENRFGGTEVFCFYDGERFVGMACLLNTQTISHIIYLAVDESLRGHGYGSKALELLHNSKSDKKIMVDIEVPNELAENAEQRRMRKRFYLRAGYKETQVKYEWRNENYEILSFGGQISEAEYNEFWEDLRKQSEA